MEVLVDIDIVSYYCYIAKGKSTPSPLPQSGVGKTNLIKKVQGPEKNFGEKNYWVKKILVEKKLG